MDFQHHDKIQKKDDPIPRKRPYKRTDIPFFIASPGYLRGSKKTVMMHSDLFIVHIVLWTFPKGCMN